MILENKIKRKIKEIKENINKHIIRIINGTIQAIFKIEVNSFWLGSHRLIDRSQFNTKGVEQSQFPVYILLGGVIVNVHKRNN